MARQQYRFGRATRAIGRTFSRTAPRKLTPGHTHGLRHFCVAFVAAISEVNRKERSYVPPIACPRTASLLNPDILAGCAIVIIVPAAAYLNGASGH